MKLIEIKEITGKIVLKSGLHIGAGDTEMRIGGTDNPVIKHPHTHEPYIPGSSLKGKVRSLLELSSGLMGLTNGAPLGLNHFKKLEGDDKEICRKIITMFGASGADAEELAKIGASRLSFADSPLDEGWKKNALIKHQSFTEVKSENSINRIKGTAENPRFTERVPADTVFSFCIVLKVFKDDEDLEDFLLKGLKLLEMDALGGSGSRGYGRLKFEFDDSKTAERFDKINPLS
ncbi:MAG: type III-A CRISPR-associated RAMP protein Csm3 [Thermodesulfobacteriota bacterium]|nr:type III-A CRISPR-associated RAMP protein Csm3 [Thermodesulfobacteriota bacterium]